MLQAQARPLQGVSPGQQFDANTETLPCDLSPIAKAWTEPLVLPGDTSGQPKLKRAEVGIRSNSGQTSASSRIEEPTENDVTVDLSDSPEKVDKTVSIEQQSEKNGTQGAPVGAVEEPTPSQQPEAAEVIEDSIVPDQGLDETPPVSDPGMEKRQSLFHATEVVTRREQFEAKEKMQKKDPKEGTGEDFDRPGEKIAGKKAAAKAKQRAKRQTEKDKKAAKKAKAEAQKAAKKEKEKEKKAAKIAKAQAKKAAKKEKAQAKKAAKKAKVDDSKQSDEKETEGDEDAEVTKGDAAAEAPMTKEHAAEHEANQEANTEQTGKRRRKAKNAEEGKEPKGEKVEGGRKKPAKSDQGSKEKASFARRYRPEKEEPGRRWDALKQVFQAKVAHHFLRPASLEDRFLWF